jgi:hypothetical protein
MLRRVDLVRTGVSEGRIASIIRVETLSELGTKLAVCLNFLVTVNLVLSLLSFQPDDGGDTFLRNVSSYKSHAASHPR